MRSSTIIASSMAGMAAADVAGPVAPLVPIVPAVGPAITGTYLDCVATCKPILDVSAMCGLPVPADPALALNPGAFGVGGRPGWKRDASAAAGGVGPGAWGPWGGYGGVGPVAGGWGGYGGAYGGGLFSQAALGCVCSTKVVDIVAAQVGCFTCLAKVTAVTNPWLNTLAVGCGVDVAALGASAGYPLGGLQGGAYAVGVNGVATIPIGAGFGAGVAGGLVAAGPAGQFYNAQGQLVNAQGLPITAQGALIGGAGTGGGVGGGLVAAGPAGQFFNAQGQLVNAQGQPITAAGEIIGSGVAVAPAPVPAPVPAPAPAPKPASKNVLHDEDDDEEAHGADEITKRHDGKNGEHKDGQTTGNTSQPQKGGKPQFSGAEKMMSARGLAGVLLGSAAVIAFSLF